MRPTHVLLSLAFGLGAPLAAQTIVVEAGAGQGPVRDVFGVNRAPLYFERNGLTYDVGGLYRDVGVTSVRLHDTRVDLCEAYRDATIVDRAGGSRTLAQCVNTPEGLPHVEWTVRDPGRIDDPSAWDFATVDAMVASAAATGAAVYLRLGESWNGPNDTGDPASWARVAANLLAHVEGRFAPSGTPVRPAFVEVHNEPDGFFWVGTDADFYALFRDTADRARAAGYRVGGPGFTHEGVRKMGDRAGLAAGFVAAVGREQLDFLSAHYYGECQATALSATAGWLVSLREAADRHGLTGTPLHVTEWNIGLGQRCGNAMFGSQRMKSFVAAMLILMQDDRFGIEAAHFYAGSANPMSTFITAPGGDVLAQPAAWGLWAARQLGGGQRLRTQVCPAGGACALPVDAAAAGSSLVAQAALVDGALRIVIANDGGTATEATLDLRGVATAGRRLTVRTPPPAAHPANTLAVAVAGGRAVPRDDARAAWRDAVAVTEQSLAEGQPVRLALPPHTAVVVEVR